MTRERMNTPGIIPASRRRLYAVLVALIPVILLAGIEGLLRISGFGNDTVFFERQTMSGKEFYHLNPAIARRYFPRLDVEPAASVDAFPVGKAPGTKRVFFLGASSMLGYPYMNNASVSSIIRDALRQDDPDAMVEVVNVSMTAVTSRFVRDLGKACLDHDADLLVIYAGHNEYYGGLGVASAESMGPVWLTDVYLGLSDIRIVQALAAGLRWFSSASRHDQEVSGTLMEALAREQEIPFGSATYQAGIDVFTRNIGALLSEAEGRNVPVILSTVVSNLSGLPPFRSIAAAGPAGAVSTERDALLHRNDGDSQHLWEAYRLDSTYAATCFALGAWEEGKGDTAEAYRFYSLARDYDGLRFRAPSALNDAIRGFDGPGVRVADVERSIRTYARNGIPGQDLLHEHVHPNVHGYEVIAGILYPAVRQELGLVEAPERSHPLRATLTPVDSVAAAFRLKILMNSWPFTASRISLADINPKGWLEDIAYAYLRGTYTWEQMHVVCAERYQEAGAFRSAIREYEALRAATPYNVSPYLRLSSLYLTLRDRRAALTVARASLALEPTSQAYLIIGQAAYEEGAYPDAVDALRKALALGGLDSGAAKDVRLSIAVSLHRAGRKADALEEVRRLRELDPSFTPAEEFEAFLRR